MMDETPIRAIIREHHLSNINYYLSTSKYVVAGANKSTLGFPGKPF
jgi:hypothetical protein